MIRRIYVEKKRGFDVEAQGMLADISQNLQLTDLKGIRVLNRYDLEGISESAFEKAKYTIFSEPSTDRIYEENLPEDIGSCFFGTEYLQGQYDQRADSAAQCIKLMDAEADVTVKCAKIIAIDGSLSQSQLDAVKKYCINPVDSQEARMDKPQSLNMKSEIPTDVAEVASFITMSAEELDSMRKEMGLAMSGKDLKFVQKYFADAEKRNPTITEIRVIDTYWSDHCRHTTFMTKFTNVKFDKENRYAQLVEAAFKDYLEMRETVYGEKAKTRDICLMDLACIGAKYLKKTGVVTDLDESEEINACSIKVKADIDGKEEDWVVMFKNETHNHPTEIEPFGGAATCLGGAIRDPLSGRSYVYQAMRVTGSADPRTAFADTLSGKLPQRKITQGAAAGYSSYGNQIGLATGQVTEIYDPGYVAKRMEIGAVIGAAPASHIRRETPAEGDCIVLLGGKTGRDGCGGATGSSKGHTEESILTCGAEVQKGNPPVERNLQRMFRRGEVTTMIKRCNDFGAGGVSVAIGELADSLDVNLDLVPKKYDGLDGTELAISESQERMAVVIEAENLDQFKAYAAEENLEATAVAKVTNTGRFRMTWRGKTILNLSREFLNTNGVTQEAQAQVDGMLLESQQEPESQDFVEQAKKYLSDLNCCSQKGLVERFDSTIGAATILMPLGGKYQLSPAAGMAAKLPVLNGDTNTATLMSFGFDPRLSKAAPFIGAYYAVIDSVTKIAAMGGDYRRIRLTFQEYFEKMTGDAKTWGKPLSALLGALKVQKELEIPSIGGKDSMSGSFADISVPPTLVSFAVAVTSADKVISTEFKNKLSRLIYLPAPKDEDGLVEFEQFKKNLLCVNKLAQQGKILAAGTVGQGGIFMTAVKMAAGNRIGAELEGIPAEKVYEADYGSLLLEVSKDANIKELFEGTTAIPAGYTSMESNLALTVSGSDTPEMDMELGEVITKWLTPLEDIFPVRTADMRTARDTEKIERIEYNRRFEGTPAIKCAAPRVVIPVFPGTNCEVDSARAFEKAGAIVDVHRICNLNTTQLIASIKELDAKIRNSQIIMLPGGFSGGDEPDGSAKFITAVFRNSAIADAVADLMENRDGLILGICNGFQALIKLGLVPYGKIVDGTENSPTLTYNKIGRHASCLVTTRVASVKSPWFAGAQVGDTHVIPVSHGEGRFIANQMTMNRLIENGQVATQYVDMRGYPSMDIQINPNYSTMAVEAITSPDGRILGKMGHSERVGKNLYRNVAGKKEQHIFESGVKYFK